jgi:hypothetical protein
MADPNQASAQAALEADVQAMKQMRITSTADWGPIDWAALHIWAATKFPLNPTEEQRREAETFLKKWVPVLIPCGICSYHFGKHAEEVYPHTESAVAISKWLVSIHNEVNRRTGKPVYTFEEAMEHYSRLPQASAAFRAVLANQPLEPSTLLTLKHQVYDSTPVTVAVVVAVFLGIALLAAVVYIAVTRRHCRSHHFTMDAAMAYPSLRRAALRS